MDPPGHSVKHRRIGCLLSNPESRPCQGRVMPLDHGPI